MANITGKNIPDDIYAALKVQAEANRRSINSEVIVILEAAVQSKPLEPQDTLAVARRIREKTAGYRIRDE